MLFESIYSKPVFLNQFDSRHHSLVFQQLGGTPTCILLVNISQVQILAAPLELRTTALNYLYVSKNAPKPKKLEIIL